MNTLQHFVRFFEVPGGAKTVQNRYPETSQPQGAFDGPFCRLLGGSWGALGALLAPLGAVLAPLGPLLAPLGPLLGLMLGSRGLIFGDFWGCFSIALAKT